MQPLIAAAAKAILARLGMDGLLRGVPCKIHIEHGVQVTGFDAGPRAEDRRDLQVERDVASIESVHAPRLGDTIRHGVTQDIDGNWVGGKTYRLEFRIRDNGALQRFVVLEVP